MHTRLWGRIILLLWLAATCGGQAAAPPDFEEANRLYEQGKYAEAIARYENLLQGGKSSAAIWFNLGNAHFKRGELGDAIYNYRRAEALAPRDPDILANLRFARDRINGSASVQPAAWQRLAQYFTLNEVAVAAAAFFWALLLLLSVVQCRPLLRPTLRNSISAVAVLLAVSTILVGASWASQREQTAICVRQMTIHLGPLAESQAAYTVPDGTELRIENRRENWLQVADRSNRTGWVEAEKVKIWP